MHNRQEAVLETLQGIQQFMDEHNDLLATVNASGARTMVNSVVTALVAQRDQQEIGRDTTRGDTAVLAAARHELREEHMRRVVAIARAKLPDVPAFEAVRLPGRDASSQRLVAAASSLAEAAQQHKQVFVDAGLPVDFIERMQAAADAVEDAVSQRTQNRARHVGATKTLKEQVKNAHAVIPVLTAMVVPALGSDPHLVQQWMRIKRVGRKPGPRVGTVVQAAAVSSVPQAA